MAKQLFIPKSLLVSEVESEADRIARKEQPEKEGSGELASRSTSSTTKNKGGRPKKSDADKKKTKKENNKRFRRSRLRKKLMDPA